MGLFFTLLWVVTILGVIAGVTVLMFAFLTSETSSDETPGYVLASACAILPYCPARAASEIINVWKKNSL